jgi:transcriptional regulator GlxA family with amidase domain
MPRVLMIAFDGMQSLDLTGPAEVFSLASYEVVPLSIGGGTRRTSSGLEISTRDLARTRPRKDDIVLVVGGGEDGVRAAAFDRALRAWLVRAARVVRWVASVCSGAFVLATAGLLDGVKATTHWSACELLQRQFPRVKVDPNAIFVREGSVWTSAGVTTGIDMALAMVEDDLGREVADTIAARLVLYVRRPGFQSQFSEALVAQTTSSDPLGPAIAWARANLDKADVDTLARRAGLSVRTLHRRCLALLSTTPARLIDKLRVEHAQTLLATASPSQKSLAVQCGFGNTTRLKRAFERELGMAPSAYHLLHAR